MAKNLCQLVFVLLFYSCVPLERNVDDVTICEPIEIVSIQNDTIQIYLEVDSTLGEKYEAALRTFLGVKELTGNNDGPIIEKILSTCGLNIPAPWCACYLNHGLEMIGKEGPWKQPAFTPRWFEDPNRIVYTRDIDPVYTTFQKGWIGGIYFRSKGRIAHVVCVLEDFGDSYILTIEGNTNSAGSREGNGVYIRIRHKSEIYMCANWLL